LRELSAAEMAKDFRQEVATGVATRHTFASLSAARWA